MTETKDIKKTKKEAVETATDLNTETNKKKSEYLYNIGRRKTSIAKVKVFKKGSGKIVVNEKDYQKYFPTVEQQERILGAIKLVGQVDKLDVTVNVVGGGVVSQAEAIRHGLSHALIQLNPNFRKPLKKAGFLTRDSRKKERKKPGLKRARKAPQWAKR